ncbi:MAG: hypothetical protein HOK94_07665 [Candidatus Marinimicrobia bacterium]|jgi:hypothetical protein|nr:hypothetical protein [Candidatus Neomarinimicrobiota bacterium]MBT5461508.1 hypothetical protein [Candidatus Neomarinimicrobiota bacterium]MBT7900704.1 hypothetical protein [Candidatus Neomarinimicrobiota bacterium]
MMAVLEAYGWDELDLAHDFYEVDNLHENDRIPYTISFEAGEKKLVAKYASQNFRNPNSTTS